MTRTVFIFWAGDPILPHSSPLIEAQLDKLIVPLRGLGEDLHYQVRRPLAAVLVLLAVAANHGDIRLNHRVHIFRGIPVPFKQALVFHKVRNYKITG